MVSWVTYVGCFHPAEAEGVVVKLLSQSRVFCRQGGQSQAVLFFPLSFGGSVRLDLPDQATNLNEMGSAIP